MKYYNLAKQSGTTVFLTLVFMLGIFAAIAMGTDGGHWMVNKTRAQNAMDATALSAAITLLGDINRSTVNASAQGRATFNLFKSATGNNELSGINANDLIFQYSSTLTPFNPGTAPPSFVRVTVNTLSVAPILIQVLPAFINPVTITATSTAGAVGQNCSLSPFVLCADMPPGGPDRNCFDDTNLDGTNDCYGYEVGGIQSLIIACNGNNSNCGPDSLESGNYNLLDLDGLQGGKDIRDAIEDTGGRNICIAGNTLNSKPGYTWGNVRAGINNRFDSDTITTEYNAPTYPEVPAMANPTAYSVYNAQSILLSGNRRREMAAPIGDCRGLQNGNSDLPLAYYDPQTGEKSIACVFLTEHAIDQGPDKRIMVEFTGTACQQTGAWTVTNSVLNGPYKVVIFKTEGSLDS